jgi:transposase InsO family protein
MSRKANCYDNAFIESFFSSLKYELVYHHRFATCAQARTAIFDYIENKMVKWGQSLLLTLLQRCGRDRSDGKTAAH